MLTRPFIKTSLLVLTLITSIGIFTGKSNCMESPYLTLHQELHNHITEHVTTKDIILLSATCTHIRNLENKKDIWKKRLIDLKLKNEFYEEINNQKITDIQYIEYFQKICYTTHKFNTTIQYLTDNVSYAYDARCKSILNISLKKPVDEIENYLEMNLSRYPYIVQNMEIDWLLICFNISYEYIKNNSQCYDDTKNSMLHHYWMSWRQELGQKSLPDALYWSIYSSTTTYSYPRLIIHHAEKWNEEDYNIDQPLKCTIPFLENPIPKPTIEIYYEEIYKHKKFLRLDNLYIEYIENIPPEERSELLNTRLREMKEALMR